jgi:hypothetical protein
MVIERVIWTESGGILGNVIMVELMCRNVERRLRDVDACSNRTSRKQL